MLLDNDTTVPSDFFELVESSSIERFEIAAPLILDMGSGEVIYAGGRFDRYRYPSVIPEWRDGDPAHRDVGLGARRWACLRPRYVASRGRLR